MKNLIKSIAVTAAAAVLVLGLGAHKANASGVDFRIGLNLGVPVVAAPVYAPPPVPVYHVEKVRYYEGHGYRPVAYGYGRDYRHDRFVHDNGRHVGFDRNYHDRSGR